MAWVLQESFFQNRGTVRVSTITMNTGQWIAVRCGSISYANVSPWGVLHIAAALPAIATYLPVLKSVLCYMPVQAYYGETGIGTNAGIATYVQHSAPDNPTQIQLYKWI